MNTSEIEFLKTLDVTPRQLELLDALISEGSQRQAAIKLGIRPNNLDQVMRRLRAKAAKLGHAPGHWDDGVAPGYRMGKVTVQRGPNGVERRWERQLPEHEAQRQLIEAMIEAAMDATSVGRLPPVPTPAHRSMSSCLSTYVFGDPHFGVRALAAETGKDFDLAEADRITRAGIDQLSRRTPATDKALLIFMGDNTHGDNVANRTPHSGNPLDIDGRHHDIARTTAKAFIHCVRNLLEKHRHVTVWIIPGNHDGETARHMAFAMGLFFDNEPRVAIDDGLHPFKYLRFGKVLLGANHGDRAKPHDLPLIMAVDRKEDWAASEFRYFWLGHVHHDQVKDVHGVRLEHVRTLAGSDAWHVGEGYRSMRDTRAIVYHELYGEMERYTVSAVMLEP